MSKIQASLRTIVLIGIGVVAILVIVALLNYESFIHSILALIDDLKPGH